MHIIIVNDTSRVLVQIVASLTIAIHDHNMFLVLIMKPGFLSLGDLINYNFFMGVTRVDSGIRTVVCTTLN
jgi:hypothetical protein